jgi:hypothetical protein
VWRVFVCVTVTVAVVRTVVVVVTVTEWETVDVIVVITGGAGLGRVGGLRLRVVVRVLVVSDVVVVELAVVDVEVAAECAEDVCDRLVPPQPATVMAAAIAISDARLMPECRRAYRGGGRTPAITAPATAVGLADGVSGVCGPRRWSALRPGSGTRPRACTTGRRRGVCACRTLRMQCGRRARHHPFDRVIVAAIGFAPAGVERRDRIGTAPAPVEGRLTVGVPRW